MDWNGCLRNRLVKPISCDAPLISSLIAGAEQKMEAQKILPSSMAESKVSLEYDALRMLLESLALKHGYKIYNHDCYTSFLKEILKESNLGDEFDNFRLLRNAINYYGKQISSEESLLLIKQMEIFINRLKKLLK